MLDSKKRDLIRRYSGMSTTGKFVLVRELGKRSLGAWGDRRPGIDQVLEHLEKGGNVGHTANDIVVVDIDDLELFHLTALGEGIGAEEVDGWERSTFSVRTPSGGCHLYFRTDTAFRASTHHDLGYDVRGCGAAYVLIPPSWVVEDKADGRHIDGGYTVMNENSFTPAALPSNLAEMLRRHENGCKSEKNVKCTEKTTKINEPENDDQDENDKIYVENEKHREDYLKKVLKEIEDRSNSCKNGERNSTLYYAARNLYKMGNYLDYEIEIKRIKDLFRKKGLYGDEIEATCLSAAKNCKRKEIVIKAAKTSVIKFTDHDKDKEEKKELGDLLREFVRTQNFAFSMETGCVFHKSRIRLQYGKDDTDQFFSDCESLHGVEFKFQHTNLKRFFLALFNGEFLEIFDVVSEYPVMVWNPSVKAFSAKQYGTAAGTAHLDKLVSFFDNAKEGADRILIKAAFMTPMVYGFGQVPLMIVCADDRGSGKTTLVNLISRLYHSQNYISVSPRHSETDIAKRLLTRGNPSNIILMDNIKAHLDNEYIERSITDRYISGHRMYCGEASIPNKYVWFLTANVPRLSRDLTERSFMIHLKKPAYTEFGAWERRIVDYIERYRMEILGEIHTLLAGGGKRGLRYPSRWSAWVSNVLYKCVQGQADLDDLAEIQKSRIDDADTQKSDAEMILEMLRQDARSREDDGDLFGQPGDSDGRMMYYSYQEFAEKLNEAGITSNLKSKSLKAYLQPMLANDLQDVVTTIKTNGSRRVRVSRDRL